MKKYLTFIIVGFFILSGLRANAGDKAEKDELMSETVVFSQLVLNENEDYISIELAEAKTDLWEKGKPKLPVVTKVYTYPFGSTIDNVEVTFSDIKQQKISKPIVPSPELYIDSLYYSNNIKKSENIVSYSDIDVYPENHFTYKTGAGLKGEEHVIYLSVQMYPVQYIPKENTIYYTESASIDISYNLPKNPVTFPDIYDFLIITPAKFKSALQRLVDHKNSLNPPVRTKLVTLNDILLNTPESRSILQPIIPSSDGVDEQEDIKFFIKDAIEKWGITYVLLVGAGVEGKEIFPVRQAWIRSTGEDYFPSDLYFADIYNSTGEFADWDVDEDGQFAEYPKDKADIDVIPDVYLGKIPCNNVIELNTVIDKIIYYKEHNKMTKKIIQVGGDSYTEDSIMEGEYSNTKVLEKLPGYSTTQLWASNGKLTKNNIAAGFKSNVDFVDFSGHGSWASFSTHPPKDENHWIPPKTLISGYSGFLYFDFELYLVNNAKKYPVCVYKSCSNSKYTESPKCFSWKTLNKKNGGGIAVFASSGISYGAHGTDIVNRTTGWMEVKTFEELMITKILGQVWGNIITEYFNSFILQIKDWKTLLEWSMFGDPTLVIEDGVNPMNRASFNSNSFFRYLEQFPILKLIFQRLQLL